MSEIQLKSRNKTESTSNKSQTMSGKEQIEMEKATIVDPVTRQQLAHDIYTQYRNAIHPQLPEQIEIVWNDRIVRSAGRTNMLSNGSKRYVRIDLSGRVLTNLYRLKSTLLHEFCHVLTFLVNGERKDHHGEVFKDWGRKANIKYPQYPVKRVNNYETKFKVIYKCVKCPYKIGRQRLSLDLKKHVCGKCRGKLEIMTMK